jgi:predicted RNase H-like HicB family nuclease
MQLAIAEAYAREALNRAVFKELGDGDVVARVPGLKGVIAFGGNREEAAKELCDVVEDWVLVGAKRGHYIPPLGGIDLNTEENRRLAYE